MTPKLASWNWTEIIRVYRVLGEQLQEYARLKPIFGVDETVDLTPKPGQVIPISDFERALAVGRWLRDVTRINAQINALDVEIARRNKLIGVIG